MIFSAARGRQATFRGIIGLCHFFPKLDMFARMFETKLQNAKVKMRGKNTLAYGHTSILQFEIYILYFELAAAKGRAMKRSGNGSGLVDR